MTEPVQSRWGLGFDVVFLPPGRPPDFSLRSPGPVAPDGAWGQEGLQDRGQADLFHPRAGVPGNTTLSPVALLPDLPRTLGLGLEGSGIWGAGWAPPMRKETAAQPESQEPLRAPEFTLKLLYLLLLADLLPAASQTGWPSPRLALRLKIPGPRGFTPLSENEAVSLAPEDGVGGGCSHSPRVKAAWNQGTKERKSPCPALDRQVALPNRQHSEWVPNHEWPFPTVRGYPPHQCHRGLGYALLPFEIQGTLMETHSRHFQQEAHSTSFFSRENLLLPIPPRLTYFFQLLTRGGWALHLTKRIQQEENNSRVVQSATLLLRPENRGQ